MKRLTKDETAGLVILLFLATPLILLMIWGTLHDLHLIAWK